jgi:aquaporin Z
MAKYLTELIGTFFLVLTIGLTVIQPGAGTLAPLAIGSVLMVMIYAGGHVSGGHYNPAVTLGVWLRGKHPTGEVLPYMGVQVLGAIVAGLLVNVFKPTSAVTAAQPAIVAAFLAELVFTFALVYVVLNVATAEETSGNSYFGLAIGFTVLVGAFAVGSISGGAFNPAVAVGISLMGLSSWVNIWIFLVSELVGGALAAYAFKAIHPAKGKPAMAVSESQSEQSRSLDGQELKRL